MRGINIPQFTKMEKEGIYLTKQLVLIGAPGYGFHALLNMPDPTLLTKLAAIADGIVLMERVVNFKRRVEKLMDEPFIPVS